MEIGNMQKYPAYKDSGVEWLGEIPKHWDVIKLKYLVNIFNGDSLNDVQKKKYSLSKITDTPYISSKDINVNTSYVNYENGLRIPKEESQFKLAPSQSILMCIEGGSAGRKIAFINQKVCFVNKLACLYTSKYNLSKYIFYSLFSHSFQAQFKLSMTGLIGGVSISSLNNIEVILPSFDEQEKIAKFLDDKCENIEKAISQKEQLISLLKERKQILIQEAVTKGLDSTVAMKDSGVEWIGEIPEHWEVKKLKYLLKERSERTTTGEEPLFMVSQIHGLVVRSEYHSKAEIAQTNMGHKLVYENDLVFNKLKAHLGVFFKSEIAFKGIVSPDYAVYFSTGNIEMKILEFLFRHPAYIGQFIIRATGIVEGLIRLYTSDLFDIEIPLAPLFEQKKIVEYIEKEGTKIDKAISLQEQQISKLKEYKSTLINSVVTGKVKI